MARRRSRMWIVLAAWLAGCASPSLPRDAAPIVEDAAIPTDAAIPRDAAFVDTNPADTGACAVMPTFDELSSAVLLPSCALPGCHSDASPDPGGDLRFGVPDARARLVGIPSIYGHALTLVIPGDVTGSFLWQKLTNALPADGQAGAPMPLAAPGHWTELPADQLELVRCWIAGGAL